MVLTPSVMLPLGTKAPDFLLPDAVSGKQRSLADVRGRVATLVMFICNHCPYVKHVEQELASLGRDYLERGIGMVAISANDADAYPEDAPDRMRVNAQRLGYDFPYLYDASQQVARDYQAVCTPDFFLFDADLHCVYRGQLDDSRPGNDIPVSGQDLRAAMDALLAGQAVLADQQPSVGCNIKWKDQ